MGSVVSAIGRGITSIIRAIAFVLESIIGAIVGAHYAHYALARYTHYARQRQKRTPACALTWVQSYLISCNPALFKDPRLYLSKFEEPAFRTGCVPSDLVP
ncbi:hypothetical protein V8E52_004760 [Russula decolorans]